MQIETLKLFCDVARLRSFSRSAEIHDVTQSTASQAVHNLEERLGATLIDRSRRPWTLTESGRAFYDGCREIVERFEVLERRVRGEASEATSEIRVAAIYSVGLRHMREFVARFSRENPMARVHLDYLPPARVYEAVREDRADLGIVSFPRAGRDLAVIPWRKEPMVVACAPSHPYARLKEIEPARLSGESFIAFDRDLAIRREVDRFLKRTGATVATTLEFDNIEAIKQAVEIGSGLSLLPRPTLDREVQTGALAALTLKGRGFYRTLGIVHRKGRGFPANVARFVELLRREAADDRLAARS